MSMDDVKAYPSHDEAGYYNDRTTGHIPNNMEIPNTSHPKTNRYTSPNYYTNTNCPNTMDYIPNANMVRMSPTQGLTLYYWK